MKFPLFIMKKLVILFLLRISIIPLYHRYLNQKDCRYLVTIFPKPGLTAIRGKLERGSRGARGQPGLRRGEPFEIEPAERFDPEGLKEPEGEWSLGMFQERWRAAQANGSRVMNSPGSGFETEPSGGVLDQTGVCSCSDVETKAQVRSIDLVMVAKASLRASERPFRVSGSGRMQAC